MNCPICNNLTLFLDEKKDRFGRFYKYMICKNCSFVFEHDLSENILRLQDKVSNLYKDDYFKNTDSGWQMRGEGFLKTIRRIIKTYSFLKNKKNLVILDYGGGNGYLASKLSQNFNVSYYDKYEKPSFYGKYKVLEKPQKSDIIYAVELVEHITDIKEWDFLKELSPDVFVFTTGLSDNIKDKELPGWIYLNPDAGHMALYSSRSLYLLAKKYGFVYLFFPNISCHIFFKSRLFSAINFVALEYFIYSIFRKVNKFFK